MNWCIFLAAVVGASRSPGSLGMPVAVEVDAAQPVLAPAVKLPKIEVAGAEVVVDDVHDHPQAGPMHGLDKPLEAGCTAIVGLHGENASRVVSPRQLAGELGQGISSMTFTPNRCKWSTFWTASANLSDVPSSLS